MLPTPESKLAMQDIYPQVTRASGMLHITAKTTQENTAQPDSYSSIKYPIYIGIARIS